MWWRRRYATISSCSEIPTLLPPFLVGGASGVFMPGLSQERVCGQLFGYSLELRGQGVDKY